MKVVVKKFQYVGFNSRSFDTIEALYMYHKKMLQDGYFLKEWNQLTGEMVYTLKENCTEA